MILKTLFVRFYKSFNYDYLRKAKADVRKRPWETIEGVWYPFIRIPVDSKVTTIVGANESGKSHLLSAVEKGITGQGIARQDFCRYSQFFTVEKDKLKMPDFGFEWTALTDKDKAVVRKACPNLKDHNLDSIFFFRLQSNRLVIYLDDTEAAPEFPVSDPAALCAQLPRVFKIDPGLALPESVSIRFLAGKALQGSPGLLERLGRTQRLNLIEKLLPSIRQEWFKDQASVTAHAKDVSAALSTVVNELSAKTAAQTGSPQLAADLICTVAQVDPLALADLFEAIRNGKEGHVEGLVTSINERLATSLNFPHWWVQDKDFRLTVAPREYDLVFTIRDKTGTDYSFDERSSGLKFFLSYYVQYRAHKPPSDPPEILLMDEPDAYLSSQAQQDLLKIFNAFASPDDGKPPVQVIYVTHSPFLIDRNHAERIRVLEKGTGDEGTRVVRDASRNHYEPLRSAFGAFVAETTFIGNCNLMVEGLADQVLLANMATHLRRQGAAQLDTLDLNDITIVPVGSASHIPYMVYLARGRDVDQPAVVVMCDSDAAGNDAVQKLRKKPMGGQLLDEKYILQLGAISHECHKGEPTVQIIEIEDMIPIPLAAAAARQYAEEFCKLSPTETAQITDSLVAQHRGPQKTLFKAIEDSFAALNKDGLHIDKVGFARCVIDQATKVAPTSAAMQYLKVFEANMRVLFRRLNELCRAAERQRSVERVSRRVDREKKAFLQDHPQQAKKEQALLLFENMESVLDNTKESDAIRVEIMQMKRDFQLGVDLASTIPDYGKFRQELERVRYAGVLASQESVTATASVPRVEPPVLSPAPAPAA